MLGFKMLICVSLVVLESYWVISNDFDILEWVLTFSLLHFAINGRFYSKKGLNIWTWGVRSLRSTAATVS